MLNGLILLVAVGCIVWEAVRRFYEPQPVTGSTVILVAGIGVIINSLTAMLFFRGREDDLNIKGAFLHMAADAVVSLGVVLAGLIIVWTGWLRVDPLMSLVVAVVIFWSTWALLHESVNLLVQAVPSSIDPHEVSQYLASLPGVIEVHDLHIWALSITETALTVHLVKPQIENEDQLQIEASRVLSDRFGIVHTTIQFERLDGSDTCPQAPVGSL